MRNNKENWEEMIRSDFYPYNTAIGLHSLKYTNKFLGGPKYNKVLLYIKDKDTACYYENFTDHFKIGKHCLKLFLKDKKLFKNYLVFWRKEFKKLSDIFTEIRKNKLSDLDIIQLSALLEKLYPQAIYWEGIAYNVDAIDATLNPIIEKIISDNFKKEQKTVLSKYYNALTFPKTLSYMNRMHLEKLKLFQTAKKEGLKKSENKINPFIEKYYWINFGWGGGEEYNRYEFEQELNNLNIKKIYDSLLKAKNNFKNPLREKNKVIKKLAKREPIIISYITIFDEYAILHDLRKEGQMKFAYYVKNIYTELAERLNVPDNLIYYFWPNELIKITKLQKKPDISLLKNRQSGWFCECFSSGKCLEYYGDEALKRRGIAIGMDDIKHQKELQGTGASSGRIFGTAKICFTAQTAKEKIQEGDILVTGMTMPDFIPAIKRAAAVVTDEGGLTCHAAIICRELGKPCVVGTRLATRLIKDGAKIEVNANHGVVKIL